MYARTWVEVDRRAIAHNAGVFHRLVDKSEKVKLMAVVKSNAYGHGLVDSAKTLSRAFCDWFGVDDLDEALALRAAGIKQPILVLGYTLPSRFREAAKNKVSLTVASLESLRLALKIRNLKVHLKLETGLNRQGLTVVGKLEGSRDQVEGVYSHFAAAELADQKKFRDYCNFQMDRFEKMASEIEKVLNKKLIKHMAGTAAAINLPRSRYDLVRVGIGMYGLDPTSDPRQPLLDVPTADSRRSGRLKPALSWYSIIAQVKSGKKGERVGYNLTERLARDSKLAIVPVGYWHGYPRALSNKGEVIVKGRRCKVVGRISMDMMTIDVTDVRDVKAGGVVTLIGKGLSAEEVAAEAGTINYELVTRINPLLKRIYK